MSPSSCVVAWFDGPAQGVASGKGLNFVHLRSGGASKIAHGHSTLVLVCSIQKPSSLSCERVRAETIQDCVRRHVSEEDLVDKRAAQQIRLERKRSSSRAIGAPKIDPKQRAFLEERVEEVKERIRSKTSAEFSSSPSASSSAQARSAIAVRPKLVMHVASEKRQKGGGAAEAKEKEAATKHKMTEATEQWRRTAADQERQQQWGLKQKENALLERAREAKKLLQEKDRAERMVATKERRVRC